MKSFLWPLLTLCLLFPVRASACEWDSDTLQMEAEGVPDAVRVISGRFPRNPPLYYEMRLKRVAAKIPVEPKKWALYDDAGVASDRLHQSRDAIKWMEKKRAVLPPFESSKGEAREHWYRFHANIGTFYAHAWLREGANRQKLDDMKAAQKHIARAIEINPDAHFGREKYQLRAIEWILKPGKSDLRGGLPTFITQERDGKDSEAASKAVEGLSGLVVLGDAWQSVDVFNALSAALSKSDRRTSVSYLALLRAHELVDEGRKSLVPLSPQGEKLKQFLYNENLSFTLNDENRKQQTFKQLRAEADDWHAHRTKFMLERLRAGRHPDTDPKFWEGYEEVPAPVFEGNQIGAPKSNNWLLPAFALVGIGAASVFGISKVRRRRN